MTLCLYLLNYIMNEMLTCFHRKMTGCIFSDDAICENVWQNQNLTDFQNTVGKCIVYLSHPTIFLSKSDEHGHLIFILVLEDLTNHLQSLLLSQLQSVMDSSESQKLKSTTNYFNYIRCNWSRWLPTFILKPKNLFSPEANLYSLNLLVDFFIR